jgi:hypothetical protein
MASITEVFFIADTPDSYFANPKTKNSLQII